MPVISFVEIFLSFGGDRRDDQDAGRKINEKKKGGGLVQSSKRITIMRIKVRPQSQKIK